MQGLYALYAYQGNVLSNLLHTAWAILWRLHAEDLSGGVWAGGSEKGISLTYWTMFAVGTYSIKNHTKNWARDWDRGVHPSPSTTIFDHARINVIKTHQKSVWRWVHSPKVLRFWTLFTKNTWHRKDSNWLVYCAENCDVSSSSSEKAYVRPKLEVNGHFVWWLCKTYSKAWVYFT